VRSRYFHQKRDTTILYADRLVRSRSTLDFKRYLADVRFKAVSNWWDGLGGAADQVYVVHANERIQSSAIRQGGMAVTGA
jgi:hypothetical protein